MDNIEFKKMLSDDIEYINNEKVGGQSCGVPNKTVKLNCESMGVEISVNRYRQYNKNKELAYRLMNNLIDEYVNEVNHEG